jgi:Domain of unknown function (DUF4331)
MSQQLDWELAWQDPRLDICDIYLFRGTVGTVLVMDVDPLSGYHGFHPLGLYEFKLDLDDDGIEDVTFSFTFDEADTDRRQRWVLRRFDRADVRGVELLTGVTGEVRADGGAIRALAGPATDPSSMTDAGIAAARTTISERGRVALEDFFLDEAAGPTGGTDVGAIVLELADEILPTRTVGFWGATLIATDSGPFVMSMSAALQRGSGCGLGAR